LAGAVERLRAAEVERAAAQARAQEARATAAAERRARRRTVGLALAVLLAVLLGGGSGLVWWWHQAEQERRRAEQGRAVNEDLEEVANLLRAWRLPEAQTVMVRAEGRVAGGAAP